MKSKKHFRILFLSNHKYIPEMRGGMETTTHQLIGELWRHGADSSVACGLQGGVTSIGIRAKIQKVLFKRSVAIDSILGYRCYRAFGMHEHISDVIEDAKPDAVILQGGDKYSELMNGVARLGLPLISYLHTPDPLPQTKEDRYEKVSYIANSKFTARNHPDKAIVLIVPPLVNRMLYETQTTREFVVFVNPTKYKGLDVVLGIAHRRPEHRFLFVRTSIKYGPSNEELRSSHIPSNVTLMGPVGDMRKVYGKAKLVLAPSQCEETWGRIATEAHCSGIPVLASDAGGLPESVGKGGVILNPSSPIDTWVDAFDEILSNYDHYVNNAWCYSRRPEIDPERCVNQLLDHVGLVCN